MSKNLTKMYSSIQLPWSPSPSPAETAYRAAGLVKTQGTIFLLPPSDSALAEAFSSPPRPKTMMSSGAVALCKHFERGGASSEHGRAHPYWPLPVGSNDNKTKLAAEALNKMLKSTVWKNMMMLHRGVAVYEIRNVKGYGMRWTLNLEQRSESTRASTPSEAESTQDVESGYTIRTITFRGFLEPIEGLDRELD